MKKIIMTARRGRPKGHKLSEESKNKISATKTGQKHLVKTKKKISKALIKYFKSPVGRAQAQKTSLFLTSFWSSNEGLEFRETLGQSMHEYYDEHFKD